MKLDAKVKGGLAWAGLVVILAVPAADLLLGKPGEASARTAIVNDTKQVTPVVPVTKPAGLRTDPVTTAGIVSNDPVQRLLDKGKKMPSYISDADKVEQPAAKPVAVKPPAVKPAVPVVAKPPVQVASLAPVEATPPVPMPRSARPHPVVMASAPANEQPLIIEENSQTTAARGQIEPLPLSDGEETGQVVTGDQLEEWNSGSLADYLKRKGLLSQSERQEVQQDEQYDPDGFYLDEGPNKAKGVRRIGPAQSFFLF